MGGATCGAAGCPAFFRRHCTAIVKYAALPGAGGGVLLRLRQLNIHEEANTAGMALRIILRVNVVGTRRRSSSEL
jgi:hypothetical protein